MKRVFFGLVLATGLATPAFGDFMPENDLHLQDDVNFTSGITEEEFNQVIDQAEAFYTPIVKAQGGKLKIKRKWKSSTVNASALQLFGSWYVNMYGGLARRPEVTKDGFTLVLCHELGHHLAGFPYSSKWAANEGQSDYFATLSCARELWKNDTETNNKARAEVAAYPKQLCDERWENEADQNLCYRSMMAGLSLATLLNALNDGEAIAYETPDTNEVDKTDNKHPDAQCRLDTYVAGAICHASFNPNVIPKTEKDSAKVACLESQGEKIKARPRCWFAPTM